MANFVEGLMPHGWTPKKGEFKPLARYFPEMDFLIYLNEDCSYRADRVDAFLTVLWHPERDALVGIKLKGFRFLFRAPLRIGELPEDIV